MGILRRKNLSIFVVFFGNAQLLNDLVTDFTATLMTSS